jgi:serine/threonine protein phosphatase PrpC
VSRSGTTATVAMLSHDGLLLIVRDALSLSLMLSRLMACGGGQAHVGDSRAIVCCDSEHRPIQITTDHTASNPIEVREPRDVSRGVDAVMGE